MIPRIVTHWKTSVSGMVPALLLWWQGVGFKIPDTKQEWACALGGALIALSGLGLKDPGHARTQKDDDAK